MPDENSGIRSNPAVRLEVRLLGAAEVILDGRRLRVFDSLRLQRFLGLIVLNRDAQHRSKLAFDLWPDSNESQARTNLRKLLHELRQSLVDVDVFLEINNETVQWIYSGRAKLTCCGSKMPWQPVISSLPRTCIPEISFPPVMMTGSLRRGRSLNLRHAIPWCGSCRKPRSVAIMKPRSGGKEISGIQVRGKLEITGCQGIFEPQHVNFARPAVDPLYSLVVDLKKDIDINQGLP